MPASINNFLECWLYDAVYKHIDPQRQPKLKDIVKRARLCQRPTTLNSIPFQLIEEKIRQDLVVKQTFRAPPRPGDPTVAEAFPNWTSWHQTNSRPGTPSTPKARRRKTPAPKAQPPQVQATRPVASLPAVPRAQNKPVMQNQATGNHDNGGPPGGLPGEQYGQPSGKPWGRKVHAFRPPVYQVRAIPVDPTAAAQPTMQDAAPTFEGGWRNLLKNNNAAAMFNWKPETDANTEASNESIISTAPLFTSDVIRVDTGIDNAPPGTTQFAIFAKLDSYRSIAESGAPYQELEDDVVFLNTNSPFTTFICGLQGSGKSHSLSVIMENCLIQNPAVGMLHRPLAGVVFYFSPFTPLDAGKPCEVAYLAAPASDSTAPAGSYLNRARKVKVLVSRSNLENMKRVYEKIPGVKVYPLLLKANQLTAKTMLHLMSVQEDNTSLYLAVVTRILRDMAAEGGFNYEKFKAQLAREPFSPAQWSLLDLRLELLESFLGSEDNPNPFDAAEGSITIVDLTCPFVDSETACILFSICLDLFCASPSTTGKIVALDEAHKFMSQTSSSQHFAKSVIQNIRLQRHLGVRTVISTQDPHVHPELLELASFIIMHRFDSPRWFSTLRKHVGFHNTREGGDSAEDRESREQAASAFEMIMNLNAGQALVYCPRLLTVDYRGGDQRVIRLGTRLIKMQVRKRLTLDGGVTRNAI
ncbi:hypothetical protein TWF718_005184 [Orbilia javanica]|uniref:P-loop containing nucleoside triphosphate hydrolase protein n=1 Tax=Orbilia javanica TaxID=47235 RepID=A0AAN8NDI0_9PEZI